MREAWRARTSAFRGSTFRSTRPPSGRAPCSSRIPPVRIARSIRLLTRAAEARPPHLVGLRGRTSHTARLHRGLSEDVGAPRHRGEGQRLPAYPLYAAASDGAAVEGLAREHPLLLPATVRPRANGNRQRDHHHRAAPGAGGLSSRCCRTSTSCASAWWWAARQPHRAVCATCASSCTWTGSSSSRIREHDRSSLMESLRILAREIAPALR